MILNCDVVFYTVMYLHCVIKVWRHIKKDVSIIRSSPLISLMQFKYDTLGFFNENPVMDFWDILLI